MRVKLVEHGIHYDEMLYIQIMYKITKQVRNCCKCVLPWSLILGAACSSSQGPALETIAT